MRERSWKKVTFSKDLSHTCSNTHSSRSSKHICTFPWVKTMKCDTTIFQFDTQKLNNCPVKQTPWGAQWYVQIPSGFDVTYSYIITTMMHERHPVCISSTHSKAIMVLCRCNDHLHLILYFEVSLNRLYSMLCVMMSLTTMGLCWTKMPYACLKTNKYTDKRVL